LPCPSAVNHAQISPVTDGQGLASSVDRWMGGLADSAPQHLKDLRIVFSPYQYTKVSDKDFLF